MVGDESADERRQVDQRRKTAVEAGSCLVAEEEMLGQVERQKRPHSVIAEAFPHFGGEQPRQLSRVAEPGALVGRIDVTDVAAGIFFLDLGRLDHFSPLTLAQPSQAKRATVTSKTDL